MLRKNIIKNRERSDIMKYYGVKKKLLLVLFLLLIVVVSCNSKKEEAPKTDTGIEKKTDDSEIKQLAEEAYMFGYPLVLMEKSREKLTNFPSAGEIGAPMNQLSKSRKFPDYTFTDVVSPNADTLYSQGYVDLSKEPYILSMPDMGDRYYLMQILNGWTDVFASPGTRTEGGKAQNYALVGPFWEGKLPDNVKEIKSPTNLIWIIGRTATTGTPDDYAKVHKLQDQYKLTPLSAWGTNYEVPKEVPINKELDMKKSPDEKISEMDAQTYYSLLVKLMKENPAKPEDKPMLEKLAKLGIIPGQDFDINKLDPVIKNALEESIKTGHDKIVELVKQSNETKNGWKINMKMGVYGIDYVNRAAVNWMGYGANLPEDALYPTARVDADGQPLNGANKYVIHFDKDKLPPVKAFWSLTMYDEKQIMVKNPINRYAIGDRSNMKLNADGSLDIYIQNESPGKDKESNWLPAPQGEFNVMMRLYWPDESILKGTWLPPAIKKI